MKILIAEDEADLLSQYKEFLEKNNYLKVDLPVLSPALIPESYLEIFETKFNYLDKKEKLYLTPSPELFLKRLARFPNMRDQYHFLN